MMLIIFVVESDAKSATDDRYLYKIISERYDLSNNEIKIKYVHMGGKGKYNNRSILKTIKDYKINSMYKENKVIYVIDTDDICSNPTEAKFFSTIMEFCNSNKYELIWFNKNIEDVLLGKSIDSNQKIKESIKFANRKFNDESLLKRSDYSIKGSNAYLLLDKYFDLKK